MPEWRFRTSDFAKDQDAPSPDHYKFASHWIHPFDDVTVQYDDGCCCLTATTCHTLTLYRNVYPRHPHHDLVWSFDTKEEAMEKLAEIRKHVQDYWDRRRRGYVVAVPAAVVMEKEDADMDLEAQVAKEE